MALLTVGFISLLAYVRVMSLTFFFFPEFYCTVLQQYSRVEYSIFYAKQNTTATRAQQQ